uniref:Uncharacterized protein n=1 Tax=Glossina brevipalpis TaxID=37001 RepID=A0A1A9WZG5_9MUSC
MAYYIRVLRRKVMFVIEALFSVTITEIQTYFQFRRGLGLTSCSLLITKCNCRLFFFTHVLPQYLTLHINLYWLYTKSKGDCVQLMNAIIYPKCFKVHKIRATNS